MKISIAMATYNGAKYLAEQLASFARQSRRPDELVVCDDGSTDQTVDVLLNFQRTSPFPVRIFQNGENLGYSKNFEKSVSLCEGDVIFLSDQDDVWFDNKLDVVSGILASSPAVHVLVNDQEITDGSLIPSGRTIFMNNRALGHGEDWITAGCCTAITRQFRDLMLPFPADLIAHDGWLHRVGVALGVRQVLHEVLQYYRRHDRNTSSPLAAGAFAPNLWEPIFAYGLKDVTAGWEKELALSLFISERLSEMTQLLRDMQLEGVAHDVACYEACKADALATRMEIVGRNPISRAGAVMRFFLSGNYRYFCGGKSALKDLIR
jgi:glycosyltransferase involved in cell wall biosynthesis